MFAKKCKRWFVVVIFVTTSFLQMSIVSNRTVKRILKTVLLQMYLHIMCTFSIEYKLKLNALIR